MASTTPEARQRYRDALSVREFRFIFTAQVIAMVGMMMADFATTVLVYRRTGSALLGSLVLALAFLPHLFSGTLLSSLVDRVPVRRLMTGCCLLVAGLAALMAVPGMPVAALLGLVFLIGMVGPVLSGARAATLPEVLPPAAYIPGRSLLRLVSQLAQVVGFGLGGLLLVFVEPAAALLLESAAFVVAAVLLRVGTLDRPAVSAGDGSMLRDSLTGVREVLALRPLRRNLLLGWSVPLLAVFPEALATPYAAERAMTTAELGLLMAAAPIGSLVGEFLGIRLLSPARQVRMIAPLAVLSLAPLLGYAMRPGFVPAALLLFLAGLGVVHHLGQDRHLLQVAPERLRSRALALQTTGLMFFQGLGFAVAGVAGEFFRISAVVPVAALLGLAAVAVLRPSRQGTVSAASTL
ncbi:MFS transporter [Actinocorallia aurantiaca]|uniref:MFS transporter n=1 Tax=Actinocorallia aurantiaca TaxID=46204 RepID=A0ABP6GU60_9ACTN